MVECGRGKERFNGILACSHLPLPTAFNHPLAELITFYSLVTQCRRAFTRRPGRLRRMRHA